MPSLPFLGLLHAPLPFLTPPCAVCAPPHLQLLKAFLISQFRAQSQRSSQYPHPPLSSSPHPGLWSVVSALGMSFIDAFWQQNQLLGVQVALASPNASCNPSVERRQWRFLEAEVQRRRLTHWLWGTFSSCRWASSILRCLSLPLGPAPPFPWPL